MAPKGNVQLGGTNPLLRVGDPVAVRRALAQGLHRPMSLSTTPPLGAAQYVEDLIFHTKRTVREALGGGWDRDVWILARELAEEQVKRTVGPDLWSRYLNERDLRKRSGRPRGGRVRRRSGHAVSELVDGLASPCDPS